MDGKFRILGWRWEKVFSGQFIINLQKDEIFVSETMAHLLHHTDVGPLTHHHNVTVVFVPNQRAFHAR